MLRQTAMKPIQPRDASRLRVGVVVSDFNLDITGAMLEGAKQTFSEWRIKTENVTIVHVPGAYEIPFACQRLLENGKFDALVTLGCILKGETKHDEYIAHAVSEGVMRVMLDYKVPIAFGVLTPNTLEQAKARSGADSNKGSEAARSALEMAM